MAIVTIFGKDRGSTVRYVAAGVILFGLVSKKLEGTIVTAPMVFAAFGLLIGEAVLGLADLDFGHGFIHGLAEVTLILVLFTDAARIDLRQLRRDHNLPVRMLCSPSATMRHIGGFSKGGFWLIKGAKMRHKSRSQRAIAMTVLFVVTIPTV